MDALVGRDRSQTARQMLTAPGERRIVGGGEVEAHHPEQGVQEPFGLAQREMVEESQGQGGLDGEIRVPPLPAPLAAPAGRPGSERLRGQPHRHSAASNESLVIGRPVRNAVLRLIRGMDLRLHPCSVAPAEGHEKCAPPQGLHATTPVAAPAARRDGLVGSQRGGPCVAARWAVDGRCCRRTVAQSWRGAQGRPLGAERARAWRARSPVHEPPRRRGGGLDGSGRRRRGWRRLVGQAGAVRPRAGAATVEPDSRCTGGGADHVARRGALVRHPGAVACLAGRRHPSTFAGGRGREAARAQRHAERRLRSGFWPGPMRHPARWRDIDWRLPYRARWWASFGSARGREASVVALARSAAAVSAIPACQDRRALARAR